MSRTSIDLGLLRPHWTVEDIAETGRQIYEAVPSDQRPDWVASILLYVAGDMFLCPELTRLVDVALSDKRWPEAKDAFNSVRQLTLENGRRGQRNSRQQMVLDIGETAAKVIYNASGSTAPFDYHAGWRMAPRVKRLADNVDSQEFTESCWQLLVRHPRD
jgi:hypothetical protein